MRPKDWRNLLLVALAAALCFGGSFTCSSRSNDRASGFVDINP